MKRNNRIIISGGGTGGHIYPGIAIGNYLKNYNLITIPPNIWNGFKGCNDQFSIIANCLNLPHNEKEMVRKDPFDKTFSYNW